VQKEIASNAEKKKGKENSPARGVCRFAQKRSEKVLTEKAIPRRLPIF
jgi:hypothetical protein